MRVHERGTFGFIAGTAIWVYCILVNTGEEYITIFSNMTFELDGAPVVAFSHVPNPNGEQYLYNQTVFSQTGLSNTDHTLVMTAVLGSEPSLLLFDWAMYTCVGWVPRADRQINVSAFRLEALKTILPR